MLRDWPGAKEALEGLIAIGAKILTISLRADVRFASGYVAMGEGNADSARLCFEDACDLYERCGAPFETGRARIQLARALAALGRVDAALEELRRGKTLLSSLNAGLEVVRAEKLITGLCDQRPEAAPANKNALTKREIEVLKLVAEGLTNDSIAKRLYVSDHTIHRHLANILNKLEVSTRAAAVARAVAAAAAGLPSGQPPADIARRGGQSCGDA